MKNILTLLFLTLFFSCSNNEFEKTKAKNIELEKQIKSLNSKLDSLKKLPSVQFESIISKDISFDSLRIKSTTEYILPIKQNELKTSDSLLTQEYLNFSKKFPESYFSMYAIDRIRSIGEKQRILKINQIVGKWNWEAQTNTMLPFKGQKNEQIEFDKDKNVRFYKNGNLISEEKYELLRKTTMMHHIKFSKKGIYAISIRQNGLLSLTKGQGLCIDCGTEVYKKTE
ncbi:hypothetical protein DFQ11_1321 [Winogradskyella epiphytica]|uniref:Lipoprotein n=1 Tax=Winogradskyella epiphytica TaxID=262005 RepID=A0A2V4X405_9FLAO|nr:hypothetical protein [Winogradskyella epiphytica]PYE78479.1 hypothetical protein DFQ11_1321 [Winogradskyella epiphytica]GGW75810.1 hypothetical protein GCM10008085_29380 [Winogradskyella epiphytica]